MEPSGSGDGSVPSRLERIIVEYLDAVGSGATPDRDQLLNDNADLADDLREFFENHDRMHAVAEVPGGQSGLAAIGARIRYVGDYEILDEIARGGMGIVYRARQVGLNREVALKMILAGQFAGEADVRRFHSEAEAAGRLDHPAIVPIFEVGEHDGHHYFSMGLVEGQSLAQRTVDGPLSPTESAELVRRIADAVQYAHDRGVIHRDLKPSNILIDRDHQPRVTDFGLAKKVEGNGGLTATGQVLGTPGYMPPEQAAGRIDQVREQSDVYALGAILYAALTGRAPFQADNAADTLKQVLEQEPASPRQLNASVPRDLETVCLRCLEKDPARRYLSASDLADDLVRFLHGEAILARPVGIIERAGKWSRRRPAAAALIAVSVLATLLLAAVTGWFVDRLSRERTAAIEARNEAVAARNEESEARSKAEQAAREEEMAHEAAEAALQNARTARLEAERLQQLAEDRLSHSQRLLYASHTTRAHREWTAGNPGAARAALDATMPELRGWEYELMHALFNENQQTLVGHEESISSVTFFTDGTRIVSAGRDRSVRIWDAETGHELSVLDMPRPVVGAVVSSDGRSIVSTDGISFRLSDAETGEEQFAVERRTGVILAVAISPDGKWIATAAMGRGMGGLGPGELKLWDLATGEEVRSYSGHERRISCVIFSADSERLFSGSHDNTIRMWSTSGGEELQRFTGHKFIVNHIALSPDGTKLVSASRDETASVWDVETGQELVSFSGHGASVHCAVFHPDGDRILSGGMDNVVRMWSATDGTELESYAGHDGWINDLDISPDGRQLVSVSADATIKMWKTTHEPDTLQLAGHSGRIDSLSFSDDGQWIVSGGGDYTDAGEVGYVRIWNADTGEQTGTFERGRLIAIGPENQIVSGTYGGSLNLWDPDSGETLVTMRSHNGLYVLDFSPDGQWIVTGSLDKTVKLWDATTGVERYTWNHDNAVNCVAFNHDGSRVASGDGVPHGDGPPGLIRVWSVESGELQQEFHGHDAPVYDLAFRSDGERLVSCGRDMTVRIWDVNSGTELTRLVGHTSLVHSVRFNPAGDRIASAGGDRTVRIWDPESGQEVLVLQDTTGPLAFSPDGRRLITRGEGGALTVWDAGRLNENELERQQ